MRKLYRHSGSRSAAAILTAELGALALVFSAAIGDAGTAVAQAAAGYTATTIPTGSTTSVAVDPDTDTVYFAPLTSAELIVVDGATNTVTTTIPLQTEAAGIAVDPVTDTIYVASPAEPSSPAMVVVIDGGTNTVTATIPLPTDSEPRGVAVNSSTDTVYVADYAQAVFVIDGSTNSLTTTVSTGTGTTPVALAVDETTNVVWVGDTVGGEVQAISGASNTVIQTISPDSGNDIDPTMAVDPLTDTVYAATEPGLVTIIDGATGTISSTISLTTTGLGFAVAVDPGTGTVFASLPGEFGTTWVIDASTDTVTDSIARGGRQVAVNTATGSAYEVQSYSEVGVSWVLTPSAANAMSPVFANAVPTMTAGTAASSPLDGSALPAATYSETGQMPAGVTMSSSGVFSGTPAAGSGGVYDVTVTASNGVAPDYSQTVQLTVDEAPAITSADQTTFTTGVPGGFAVTATGFPQPTFSESGPLPAGVTLISAGELAGVLSGTPAAGTAGSYPITITASNGVGTATQAFTLTVAAPLTYQNPAITWTGTVVAITVTDSAGNLDYWWQAAGTAPWNQLPLAAASSTLTYQNPSIAWTGTDEIITATDSNGDLDYWWQAAGTAPWNQQLVAAS
jgi:large repetitive protein